MIFHGTGPKAFGMKRMLAALKARGLVPDQSGMFIIPKTVGLNSLEVETLGRVCHLGGYDWCFDTDKEPQ